MSNPFGKSAKTGYISENVKDADNLSYGRLKGALGNVQDPKEYSAGNSSMGFGNTLFNQKYNPYRKVLIQCPASLVLFPVVQLVY